MLSEVCLNAAAVVILYWLLARADDAWTGRCDAMRCDVMRAMMMLRAMDEPLREG